MVALNGLSDSVAVMKISSARSIVELRSCFIDSSISGYGYYFVASTAMDIDRRCSKRCIFHENEKINSVLGVIGVIFGFYYEPDLM